MFVRLMIVVFVLAAVHANPYNCANRYRPSHYIGHLRVPTSCQLDDLNCPASWKSGIPEGTETSAPMVYQKFLSCHEGFTKCGYVPTDSKSGEILGQSGVTIGAGVDLGSKSRASFPTLPSTIVDKLEPYFGLKGNFAACATIEHPLTLTTAEADTLTEVITNDVVDKVSKQYGNDKDKNALKFSSVPRGIRTAIVSVWFQFGYPKAYPRIWNFVTENDWENAVIELRNFYPNPEKQARGDLIRRNDEADIIEATSLECNRSVDIVFLLDDSGSVSRYHFREILDFVKNMIEAFPDEKLHGEDGARFGLSTFDNNYRPHFYLSSYTLQLDYLSAINRVFYSGGGTNLGRALELILNDQFSEERGLRPEVDGVPRILIVLTDVKSFDNVSIPAKNVRDENIVIYGIGVGGYNLSQLQEIASSESHVHTLANFTELDKFIATLTSSTCYEPRPTSLNETIKTDVEKDRYLYFRFKVTLNLELEIVDINGITSVYVSRTNPHPYKFDNDLAFESSSQKTKLMVISPTPPDENTRSKRSSDHEREIFVSITSKTDAALFTLEGNECDPMNCAEGTNEKHLPSGSAAVDVIAEKLMVASFMMFKILF